MCKYPGSIIQQPISNSRHHWVLDTGYWLLDICTFLGGGVTDGRGFGIIKDIWTDRVRRIKTKG